MAILIVAMVFLVYNRISKSIALKKAQSDEYIKYLNEARNVPMSVPLDERSLDDNDFVGVGVLFKIVDNVVVVSDVVDNSPADKAGIKVDDRIIMIDGKYARGLSVNAVSNVLKGEKGSEVTINIYRNSFGDKSRDVTIVRDFVDNSERREHSLFMYGGKGGEDLGNNYKKFRGKIYYWDDGGGQAVPGAVAIDANPETFVSLENKNCTWNKDKYEYNPCLNYAKDGSKVFYKWFEIKDADPSTFQILKGSFVKDKNYVFYDTQKVKGVDSETFQTLGLGEYGKDKNTVVYTDRKIASADVQTFQVLHEKYCLAYSNALARDKNGYYAREVKISKDQYFEHLRSENEEIEPMRDTCN